VASGRRLSGGEDWFTRCTFEILQAQARDWSVTLGNWGGTPGRTVFHTLFLVYGGAPVAVNKACSFMPPMLVKSRASSRRYCARGSNSSVVTV